MPAILSLWLQISASANLTTQPNSRHDASHRTHEFVQFSMSTYLGLVLTLSTGLVDEMDETAVIRVTGEPARVFAAGVSLTRKPVAARK